MILGFLFFTKVINPLIEPTIEGAPSVQIPTHWSHVRINLYRFDEIESKTFCPVVRSVSCLLLKNVFTILFSLMKRINPST